MPTLRQTAPAVPKADDHRGVAIAAAVLGLWVLSLVPAVTLPLSTDPRHITAGVLLVLLRTFLSTGVFITAHDAMHGLVAPGRPRLNDFIGAVCTRSYAFFSFRKLREAHHKHHDHPASVQDPDWHDGVHPGFFRWLFAFGRRYLHWSQVLVIAITHNIAVRSFGAPEPQMWLYVWLPPVLSAVQLFAFGTFLPHRAPEGGHSNAHAARSSGFPPWLSFLTCYHFGYHLTHHTFPWVPWWGLPAGRRVLLGRTR